jgi:hypothetical protein
MYVRIVALAFGIVPNTLTLNLLTAPSLLRVNHQNIQYFTGPEIQTLATRRGHRGSKLQIY